MVLFRYDFAMNTQRSDYLIYSYLDRIGNLIRAQEWTLCRDYDIQPVQLRMLYYLMCCNRYSNTPSGVTAYFQLTKGTVSQSINLLEKKGFVEKQADQQDKRQIHLAVTDAGRTIVEQLPPEPLSKVSQILGEAATTETILILRRLLATIQQINTMQGFGVCRTCHYHQAINQHQFRCGLTGELLAEAEANLICREHIPAEK